MDRIEYFKGEKWGERARPAIIKTVEEYNELARAIQKNNKHWFDKMLSLCKSYYEKEPVGGSLHIVLEDGNLEDRNVAWCQGLACGMRDWEGHDIACLMELMTPAQRKKLYRNIHH